MAVVTLLFYLAFFGYVLDLGIFLRRLVLSRPVLRSQRWVLYGAFALHTLSLIGRAVQLKQCPIFSLHDSVSFLAWATMLGCLLLRWRFPRSPLEGFAPAVAAALMGVSMALGYTPPMPLNVPERAWVSLHAGLYFLGYAAFAIAFLAGGVYLLLENQLKNKHLRDFAGNFGSLDTMDRINHAALRAGVLCLTVGIGAGIAVLTTTPGKSLDSLWTDPKIVLALFTWALYALLLFVRSTNRLRGRKVAFLSVAGFAVVFVTFLGVHHVAKVF